MSGLYIKLYEIIQETEKIIDSYKESSNTRKIEEYKNINGVLKSFFIKHDKKYYDSKKKDFEKLLSMLDKLKEIYELSFPKGVLSILLNLPEHLLRGYKKALDKDILNRYNQLIYQVKEFFEKNKDDMQSYAIHSDSKYGYQFKDLVDEIIKQHEKRALMNYDYIEESKKEISTDSVFNDKFIQSLVLLKQKYNNSKLIVFVINAYINAYIDLIKKDYIYEEIVCKITDLIEKNNDLEKFPNIINELKNIVSQLKKEQLNILLKRKKLATVIKRLIEVITKYKLKSIEDILEVNIEALQTGYRIIGTAEDIKASYQPSRKSQSKVPTPEQEELAKEADVFHSDDEFIIKYNNLYSSFRYELSILDNSDKNGDVVDKLQELVDRYIKLGLGCQVIWNEIQKTKNFNYELTTHLKDMYIVGEVYKYYEVVKHLRLSGRSDTEYMAKILALGSSDLIQSMLLQIQKEALAKYQELCDRLYAAVYNMTSSDKEPEEEIVKAYQNIKRQMIMLVVEFDLTDQEIKEIEEQVKLNYIKENKKSSKE